MINVKALPIVDALTTDGQPLVAILGPNHEVYWEAVKKMEGILPLIFESRKGGPLKEYKIYGNTPYQEWTPSPERERTANLFDPTTKRYEFVAAPNITSYSGAVMFFVPCKKNTTYYILFKTDYESWVRFGTVSKPYVAGEIAHYTSDTSSTPSANTKTSVDTHDYEWLFIQVPSSSINMLGGLDAVRNSIMVSENPITVFEPYGYREKTGPCEVKGVGERTGNLLDLKNFHSTKFTPIIKNNDISFVATGIFQGLNQTLPLDNNENYVLSVGGITVNGRIEIRYYLDNEQVTTKVDLLYENRGFKLRKDIVYNNVTLTLSNGAGEAGEYKFSNVQLTKSSTTLPYEPYGYKTTVVDNGKNLFDESDLKNGYHLDTYTGLPTENNRRCSLMNPIKINSNVYRLTYNPKDNEVRAMYSVISNNGTLVRRIINILPGDTIDTSKGAYLYIAFYISMTKTAIKEDISNIMLTKDTIETTIYHDEPYFTNDYIRKDKDGGVEHREWAVKILDGSENWNFDTPNKRFFLPAAIPSYQDTKRHQTISTHYNGSNPQASIDGVTFAYANQIFIYDYSFFNHQNPVSDFKSFLKSEYDKGTPVMVYYKLATPTDTEKDLPDIVTASGYNSIDTDTQIKPEKMEIAYR